MSTFERGFHSEAECPPFTPKHLSRANGRIGFKARPSLKRETGSVGPLDIVELFKRLPFGSRSADLTGGFLSDSLQESPPRDRQSRSAGSRAEGPAPNQISYSGRIIFARRPAQSHSFGAVPGFPFGDLWTNLKNKTPGVQIFISYYHSLAL
jgi:hypothetical protein